MNLKVYGKTGKLLFDGDPRKGGAFDLRIPAPVWEALVFSWNAHAKFYDGDFEKFWNDYVKKRFPTSSGLAYKGYGVVVE